MTVPQGHLGDSRLRSGLRLGLRARIAVAVAGVTLLLCGVLAVTTLAVTRRTLLDTREDSIARRSLANAATIGGSLKMNDSTDVSTLLSSLSDASKPSLVLTADDRADQPRPPLRRGHHPAVAQGPGGQDLRERDHAVRGERRVVGRGRHPPPRGAGVLLRGVPPRRHRLRPPHARASRSWSPRRSRPWWPAFSGTGPAGTRSSRSPGSAKRPRPWLSASWTPGWTSRTTPMTPPWRRSWPTSTAWCRRSRNGSTATPVSPAMSATSSGHR